MVMPLEILMFHQSNITLLEWGPILADELLSRIDEEQRKSAIHFQPGFTSASVDSGWITVSEYDYFHNNRSFESKAAFHMSKW